MGMSYGYSGAEEIGQILAESFAVMILPLLLSVISGVAIYIFKALARYTIAKRRGIQHAWTAWVPVADNWLVGCISDQYQYIVRGKNTKRRRVLLGLGIASEVLSLVMIGLYIRFFVVAIMFGSGASYAGQQEMERMVTGAILPLILLILPMMAVSITHTVFYYMATFDTYKSCSPNEAVLYLVLGIFIGLAEPIFLFVSRNKDEGMPPRRESTGMMM